MMVANSRAIASTILQSDIQIIWQAVACAHPEARREPRDGGKQPGHGIYDRVDLDIQVICPDLGGQTLRPLLGLLAAVHRAHVDCGEHPAWTANPFTTAGSWAVSSGNPGSVCPNFAGAGRMLLRGKTGQQLRQA